MQVCKIYSLSKKIMRNMGTTTKVLLKIKKSLGWRRSVMVNSSKWFLFYGSKAYTLFRFLTSKKIMTYEVSYLCSSYAFGLIWANEFLNMFLLVKLVEVFFVQSYECISLSIFHHFERLFALKNILLLSQKNNWLFSQNNRLFSLCYIWIKLLWFLCMVTTISFLSKPIVSQICIYYASE